MTNFLQKLMFWRKGGDAQAAGSLPTHRPNDDEQFQGEQRREAVQERERKKQEEPPDHEFK